MSEPPTISPQPLDLRGQRVVPVVVLDDAAGAVPLGEALVAGGMPLIEVTLRTDAGLRSLELLAAHGGLLVGAGTVLTAADVDAAVDVGATYLVSPGLSATVVERARERRVPILPGVATASDIMTALAYGLTAVKLFPAEVVGGVAAIRALAGPFPHVQFVPTGGVTPSNLARYLAEPAVLAVGGSWMVPRDVINRGDFGEVERLAAEAVALAAEAGAAAGSGGAA